MKLDLCLTDEQVAEFAQIYQGKYGVTLGPGEARDAAERTVRLIVGVRMIEDAEDPSTA